MTTNENQGSEDYLAGKLSIEETARQMAAEAEDWSEWDVTIGDGLDEIPFELPTPRSISSE